MNDDRWRTAFELYVAAADLPAQERKVLLDSSPVDPEVMKNVAAALEDAESPDLLEQSFTVGFGDNSLRSGARVGRYVVTTLLGRGGIGEVYAARDEELGRSVALKFLKSDAFPAVANLEGFIREARAASALNHPNILTVYEVIRFESGTAIAMELVEGRNLRTLCGHSRPVDQVLDLGQQIAQALGVAHVNGIVHCDVKPENVMVRRDGYVKVLDFGLARQISAERRSSGAGLPVGTLQYMSPEQIRAEPITGASDVFSLGVVLYDILGGFRVRSGGPDHQKRTAGALKAEQFRPAAS